MNLSTVQKMRDTFPHLTHLSDGELQIFLDDAALELSDLRYDSKYEEKIHRYLAAHLATLSHPRAEEEQIDTLRKRYKIPDSADPKVQKLAATAFGIEVLRMIAKNTGGLSLVVKS
jgi:hypothetical protein